MSELVRGKHCAHIAKRFLYVSCTTNDAMQFSEPVHACSGVYPASCEVGTDSPGGKAAGARGVNHQHHLAPRLNKVYLYSLHGPSRPLTWITLLYERRYELAPSRVKVCEGGITLSGCSEMNVAVTAPVYSVRELS